MMNYTLTRQAGELIAEASYPTFPLYRKDSMVYRLCHTEAGGLVISTQTYATDRWTILLPHHLSHAELVEMATEVDAIFSSVHDPSRLKEGIDTITHAYNTRSEQRIISGNEFLDSGKWARVSYDISALIRWNGWEWELTTEDESPSLQHAARVIQDTVVSQGVLISNPEWVTWTVQERLKEYYEDLAERNPKAHRRLLKRKEWY